MIFYFSGTGNSAAAAGQLLSPGEKLISMAEANRAEAFVYSPEEDENVGFVFPVYFYGLPDTVRRFAQNVIFDRQPQYVYAVITCGGSIAGAGDLLKKALMARGIELRAVYTVKMPDNYVLLYDVTTEAQEKPILAAAEQSFARIRESVALRRFTGADVGVAARAQTAAIYPFYDLTARQQNSMRAIPASAAGNVPGTVLPGRLRSGTGSRCGLRNAAITACAVSAAAPSSSENAQWQGIATFTRICGRNKNTRSAVFCASGIFCSFTVQPLIFADDPQGTYALRFLFQIQPSWKCCFRYSVR